ERQHLAGGDDETVPPEGLDRHLDRLVLAAALLEVQMTLRAAADDPHGLADQRDGPRRELLDPLAGEPLQGQPGEIGVMMDDQPPVPRPPDVDLHVLCTGLDGLREAGQPPLVSAVRGDGWLRTHAADATTGNFSRFTPSPIEYGGPP